MKIFIAFTIFVSLAFATQPANTCAVKAQQFDFTLFDGLDANYIPYAEFTLGFLAGGLPEAAQYFENRCVRHSGEFFSASFSIYILIDKIDKGMAQWYDYLALATYVTQAANAGPLMNYHCRDYFYWMYQALQWIEDMTGFPNLLAFMYEGTRPSLPAPKPVETAQWFLDTVDVLTYIS